MAFSDKQTYAPLSLFEYSHDPGHYCLMLSDHHMVKVEEVFEANGQYGNGYGWTGVARQAIRVHAAALADRIEFDSEAGTFVAHGRDLDALRRLGGWLRDAFHDRDQLVPLVRDGDPEWFD